jgi:hypothetical protein
MKGKVVVEKVDDAKLQARPMASRCRIELNALFQEKKVPCKVVNSFKMAHCSAAAASILRFVM